MNLTRAGMALAALLAFTPVAIGGGTQKVPSTITYQNSVDNGTFIHQGEVKSELRRCERDRRVDLYGEGFDEPFESDRTNDEGRYRIVMPGDGIPQDYYTRVRPLHKGSITCKGDESKHKPLD